MDKKFFRRTGVPDANLEFCSVRERECLITLFLKSESVLYLVYDRYIGDRRASHALSPLALLVLKTLRVGSFRHLFALKYKSQWCLEYQSL